MKNNHDFRAFLHELRTKKEVQTLAAQAFTLLFSVVAGLAIVIALFNAINHVQ